MGKPWARVQYHDAFTMSMPLNLTRGLIINILACFFLTWILSRFSKVELKDGLICSLAVGLIAYFTIPYIENIWFNESSLGYLIDTIVSWGLVGFWLGFWLSKDR
jgi:fluoride ion exporter CrcB/FEX